MRDVFLQRVGVDEDVIKVNKDKVVEHVTEDVINQVLQYSRGVGKAERHDKILEVSQRGAEGSFPFVPFVDSDEVISVTEVQFGQKGVKAELISGRGYVFLMVMSLRPRMSMQGRRVPSFLSSKKNPAPTGDGDDQMMPATTESRM